MNEKRSNDSNSPSVAEYMTARPHTIGRDQTLERAHAVMREYGIRHLPVLDGGKVVGLVSSRDLHLIETLRDVDPATVFVEEAMAQDPYTVAPETPLAEVVATMAKRQFGSVIVTDGRGAIGIFTTMDALRALGDLLGIGPTPQTA
jgi:acetoin utilization protein AcuB